MSGPSRRGLPRSLSALLVVALLLASACGDGDGDGSVGIASEGAESTTTASTVTLSATTETTSVETTETTSAEPTSSTDQATTSQQTATSEAATTESFDGETGGNVVEPHGLEFFATPSGNILCLVQSDLASCWISDKEWTIEQPSGPDCAESDWGNVIEVTAEEAYWPCYTDFGFDPDAMVLPYGDAMVVAGFRCDSARDGVTCVNGSGQGFRLARAEAVIF